MCDTPGQDDFDTLRPLVYPNTDVFLLCFSVVSPSSFANIREKWIPEIKKSREKGAKKHVPIILVGTQSDLRNDVNTRVELAKYKEQPVTETEAKKLAKDLGCENFIETSALTQHNLKEVFDKAIMASLKGRKIKEKKLKKKLLDIKVAIMLFSEEKKQTQNSTKSHSVLFSDKADQNATKSLCVLRPDVTDTG